MYKIFTSLWSKSSTESNSNKPIAFGSETFIDEDDWVLIAPATRSVPSPTVSQPDQSTNVQHFNPIENLLIEHASMSVYDQIAFQTRHRRHRNMFDDEDGEDKDDEEDGDDAHEQSAIVFQFQSEHPNTISIDQTNLSVSMEQNRHVHRFHQRRKRALKSNSLEKSNQFFNKYLERQRFNATRLSKLILHQPSRSKH